MDSINNSLITDTKGKVNTNVDTDTEKLKRAEKLREACAGFEGMFFAMMMKSMRQATESFEGGVVSKGKAEKIFTEMLDSEYITAMGKNSGTGIGDSLYKHIIMSVNEFKDLQDLQPNNSKSTPTKNSGDGKENSNIINKLHELKSMRDKIPQDNFMLDNMLKS